MDNFKLSHETSSLTFEDRVDNFRYFLSEKAILDSSNLPRITIRDVTDTNAPPNSVVLLWSCIAIAIPIRHQRAKKIESKPIRDRKSELSLEISISKILRSISLLNFVEQLAPGLSHSGFPHPPEESHSLGDAHLIFSFLQLMNP